ncbi:type II toxin-antitoxin system VapC family toxin [Labrys monachus]|uniref:Ribonuclease VapC n=1 Tax=Labrys monachus TaxID=217067 RepID=A0ABU0FEK7_9HYPH|nr:type II toxin-antitoxin system VapC family toxin [Labrys monachus]MDQ0393041.1 PIN domain nuclease of toxin-antitoxin system [Labrys monachus]
MASALLLDTCAVIWAAEGAPIDEAATRALNEAALRGDPVRVCPITAWEIGLLVSRGRLKMTMSPHAWFRGVLTGLDLHLTDMPPDLLIASSFLPGDPPRDPADRIIAATAREYGCTLVTRDRLLLAYAEQGHMQALAC